MQVQCFLSQSTSYANEWPALCLFFNKRGAFFFFLRSTRHTSQSLIISETEAKLNCCASATQEGPTATQVFTVNATVSPRGDNNKKLPARLESSIQVVQSWIFFWWGEHSSLFLRPKTSPPLPPPSSPSHHHSTALIPTPIRSPLALWNPQAGAKADAEGV